MAKGKRRKGENISAYFRGVFKEMPHWLTQKSNNELVARYRTDHNLAADADVGLSVKQTMANVKSLIKKNGFGGSQAVAKKAPKPGRSPFYIPPTRSKITLDTLEELIDECLASAKQIDPHGLEKVIRSLRSARNRVIWKLGEND